MSDSPIDDLLCTEVLDLDRKLQDYCPFDTDYLKMKPISCGLPAEQLLDDPFELPPAVVLSRPPSPLPSSSSSSPSSPSSIALSCLASWIEPATRTFIIHARRGNKRKAENDSDEEMTTQPSRYRPQSPLPFMSPRPRTRSLFIRKPLAQGTNQSSGLELFKFP